MNVKVFLLLGSCTVFVGQEACADSVTLTSGRVVNGLVLQQNSTNVVVKTEVGVFAYPLLIVKEVKSERAEAEDVHSSARVPNENDALLQLGKQSWASNLKQIPATLIDVGILRNVPYTSYRCGEDYEVNVYGDLSAPAGFEIGVYHGLIGSPEARSNCFNFIISLLGQAGDRDVLRTLDRAQDKKSRDGLTFEITPSSDPDSYGGWWISIYSEDKLNRARASDDELKEITVAKSQQPKGTGNPDNPSWTADEMKLARPYRPKYISFGSVTNAEVVRVIDGAALVWKSGASGGVVKLADLPQDLQVAFGYDPAKAASFDATEQERHSRDLAQAQAYAAQASAVQTASSQSGYYDSSSYAGGGDGGRVFVHGYYRSNGTYVNSYTRSYPRR
jgi:hypothetical protein